MVEGIPWPAVGVGTMGWLLAFAFGYALVHSFIKGAVVPRSALEDKSHEAQEWRTEGRIKDQQIAEKDAQLAEKDTQLREKDVQLGRLLEVANTIRAVMGAIQSRREQNELDTQRDYEQPGG